ncbi:MAG: Flp pilus assembly protein CpaB [Alphaproteobacteria bacterium]|nr:Flp pilus assembly protein CpaB [Alphaproteobacteria bacterium]
MDSRGTIRALVALLVAVVFGGIAVVSLFQLITSYQARIDEAKKPEDTVMVIVAARDLYPGVTITEDDLVAVEIPPRFLAGGVFLSPEHVVGQRPRERILANEFVRAERLANPESGEGLNAIIPREMRAISVEISDGAALSGFLDPGNYVDVLVTIDPESEKGGGKEVETHTLLQAVFVLGVNSKAQNEQMDASVGRGNKKPSVTLLVTAQQAEQIAHAEAMGDIRLALRNDLDNNFVESQGADVAALLGILKKQDAPRTRKPAPKPATPAPEPEPEPSTTGVLIIQGNKVREEEVIPE